MKKVFRNNVFETNSSAVHSLTIDKSGLKPSELPVDKEGYIITDFGNFGDYDMGVTLWTQSEKLSYLATECYYLNGFDVNIEDSTTWMNICDAIIHYTGCRGVRLLKQTEPSLNHQAQPEYDLKFCDDWDENSVINFVFNKYIGIYMTHD